MLQRLQRLQVLFMSFLLIVQLCSQVFRLSFFYTIRLDAETHQNRSPSMVNFAESSPATRVSSGSIAGATSTFNCGIHICWLGQSESPRQLKGRRVRRPLIAQKAAPCKWLLWRISCEMHTSTTTNAEAAVRQEIFTPCFD